MPELDPPLHRDDLSPEKQEFFTTLAAATIDQSVELMRPEFEAYVARIAPDDPDDDALARRFTERLPALDADILSKLPAHELAASAREALTNTAGYLRDAAITFRTWDFRPEHVTCPTTLWYGELDPNASPRNGHWLATHIPQTTLVLRLNTAH